MTEQLIGFIGLGNMGKPMAGHVAKVHSMIVHDIAGTAENGADVDMATCTPRGPGARNLCATWQDPDFDPDIDAVYYSRVIENPSCRWSTRLCLSLPAAERPDGCMDERIPATIQERAWTSPIWYGQGEGP